MDKLVTKEPPPKPQEFIFLTGDAKFYKSTAAKAEGDMQYENSSQAQLDALESDAVPISYEEFQHAQKMHAHPILKTHYLKEREVAQNG